MLFSLPFLEQEQEQQTQEEDAEVVIMKEHQQNHPDDLTALTYNSDISHSLTVHDHDHDHDHQDDETRMMKRRRSLEHQILVGESLDERPLQHSTSCEDLTTTTSCGGYQRRRSSRRRSSCSLLEDMSRRGSFAALDLSESQFSLIQSLKLLEMEIIMDHNHNHHNKKEEKKEEDLSPLPEKTSTTTTTTGKPLHDRMMKTFLRNVETIYFMLTEDNKDGEESNHKESFPFLLGNEI